MSSKINELPPRHQSKFTEKLAAYDLEVDKACLAIKDNIDKIIEKQYDIADKFIELIDEVLHAKSDNLENKTDEPQQSRNSADSVGQSYNYIFSYIQNLTQTTCA
jgi:DNA-binding NtrC family response regulator